jgi:hypothetical protein
MIGTSDPTVIVRIPVENAKVRIGGEERSVLRLAQGFCFAEYGDGNVFPLSNPLEEWLISVCANAPGGIGQQVYFVFEAAGPRSNDGQGTALTDVTNIQTGL